MSGHSVDRHLGKRDGLRWTITWLHARAKSMHDPKAKSILNSAAFDLGIEIREGRIPPIRDDNTTTPPPATDPSPGADAERLSEFLLRLLDTALRDAEALRSDLKLHQGMHAVTIEQYEALRREVGRLRPLLDACLDAQANGQPLPEQVDRATLDAESGGTKSLRHPLPSDTLRCPIHQSVVVETDGTRRCNFDDCTWETRPAASGEDVERADGICNWAVACGFMRDAGSKFIPLREAILAALTAARLSGRTEMAKLDEPVIEWANEALTAMEARAGWSLAHDQLRKALAARDAALKALPE